MRVSSQGPPLRNVIGDLHSLLEDEIHDQTNHLINQNLIPSNNNSNMMASASGGNIINQHRNS
jgi:hypothetical protein